VQEDDSFCKRYDVQKGPAQNLDAGVPVDAAFVINVVAKVVVWLCSFSLRLCVRERRHHHLPSSFSFVHTSIDAGVSNGHAAAIACDRCQSMRAVRHGSRVATVSPVVCVTFIGEKIERWAAFPLDLDDAALPGRERAEAIFAASSSALLPVVFVRYDAVDRLWASQQCRAVRYEGFKHGPCTSAFA
jgi:hypothetical protein